MSVETLPDNLLALRAFILALMTIDRRGKSDYPELSATLDATLAEVQRRPSLG